MSQAKVFITMGSESDLETMYEAGKFLKSLDVQFEIKVLSAHRTPKEMFEFAQQAEEAGIKVIIAGAGGSAHLPGMIASVTTLPVIGVPIRSKDSTAPNATSQLSISEMPPGVPVGTMAVNGAQNAAIFAVQILATSDAQLAQKLHEFKKVLIEKVEIMNKNLPDKIKALEEKDTKK